MVDDDVPVISSPQCICLPLGFVSHTETDETDYDVVGSFKLDVVILDADTVSWSCLSGDSDVAVLDAQCALELDDSGDIEYDGPWTRFRERRSERTGTAVCKSGHMDDLSPTTSGRVHSPAFGAGECYRQLMLILYSRDHEFLI